LNDTGTLLTFVKDFSISAFITLLYISNKNNIILSNKNNKKQKKSFTSPFNGNLANRLIQMKCLLIWYNEETRNGHGWENPLLPLCIHFYDAVKTSCMASLHHLPDVENLTFVFYVALCKRQRYIIAGNSHLRYGPGIAGIKQ
jgi:hypothetical protein